MSFDRQGLNTGFGQGLQGFEAITKIRRATGADVPEMLALHREAVHRTGASAYQAEILEEWSSGSAPEKWEETIARMKRNLASGEVISFVAETEDSRIAGFGDLMPQTQVLGAIYVHPDYGRQGVGGQLMIAVEKLAKQLGLEELTMDASLNAEAFYRRHGFEVIEYGEHELRGGLKMACVKMQKRLGSE